ncbi:MAG: minor capsid protein [Thermoguttaceae bacterium]|nr:minor capsid protein [Thermoguttaceae bacterium]
MVPPLEAFGFGEYFERGTGSERRGNDGRGHNAQDPRNGGKRLYRRDPRDNAVAAARLARTIINGVSNNTRVETIKENSDVIDGVKFIGTLDGKTCPYCGSLDGYIWRGEEMGQARRPPIHPNCRCTLVPYVELKDAEGNVVEVDAERPAANADFDKLAQEAYDDQARQKGWSRRWDDLAPSTRLKYYYQAQKDFEASEGKPAYSQVPASVSFADYFKGQPDEFKRSWLGAKRFEQYQNGTLTQEKLFAPDLGYMKTTQALFQVVRGDDGVSAEELAELAKESGEELQARADLVRAYLARDSHRNEQYEDLRLDGKSIEEALRKTNFREIFKRYELDEKMRERETSEMLEGFEKQDKKNKAAKFAKTTFGIDVKYRRIPLETLNDLNQELIRARNMFGTIGIIERIEPSDKVLERGSFASYNWERKSIEVRPEHGRFTAKQYIDNAREGLFSTDSPLHGYRHEIGHSLLHFCEECLVWSDRSEMIKALKELHERFFVLSKDGFSQLSEYAKRDYREMVAEAIAQLMNNTVSPLAKEIIKILKGKIYDL